MVEDVKNGRKTQKSNVKTFLKNSYQVCLQSACDNLFYCCWLIMGMRTRVTLFSPLYSLIIALAIYLQLKKLLLEILCGLGNVKLHT
jgi:hypothetical protein